MFEPGTAKTNSVNPFRVPSEWTSTAPPPKTSVCMNWRPLSEYAAGGVLLPGPLVTCSVSVSEGSARIVAATRRGSAGSSGASGQGIAKRTSPPFHALDETLAVTSVVPRFRTKRLEKQPPPQGRGCRSAEVPSGRRARRGGVDQQRGDDQDCPERRRLGQRQPAQQRQPRVRIRRQRTPAPGEG